MRELRSALAGRIGRLRRDDRGAVAIVVALLLGAGVLTGIGALVVDVGQLYQERAELQNGADAAALAVAKSCALGNCDSNLATQYADANASALTGHFAGVRRVCGSVQGLPGCPQGGGAPGNCPSPSTQNYVEVFTETRAASGGHLLPPVFAGALLGNNSYNGTDVLACAQATWGPPTSATAAAIAISACTWDQATQQGTLFAPAPPYPPSPLPDPAMDQVLSPSSAGNGTGCASEPAGADGPGAIGWLNHLDGNCQVQVTPPAQSSRNPLSYSCELLLQNAQQTQTPLLMPIYVSSVGSPPSFTLKGFAEFVVTGYNLPPEDGSGVNFYAQDQLNLGNNCSGSTYCVNGYFIRGVIGSSAGLNGTDLGVSVLQLTG